MATFIEDGVKITVSLSRSQSGDVVEIAATSLIGETPLRSVVKDITADLTPAQLTTVGNILSAAEARAKVHFDIP